MDESSYHKLFILNKHIVTDSLKHLAELKACCELVAHAYPEHYDDVMPKRILALL